MSSLGRTRMQLHVAVLQRAALLRASLAERLGEAAAVGARAVDQDVVDAREQLDVDVDVIEQERVEHLAEQERGARGARGSRLYPASRTTRPLTSRELPMAKMCVAPRRSAGAMGVFWRRPPSR